jgi:hypothetical protein
VGGGIVGVGAEGESGDGEGEDVILLGGVAGHIFVVRRVEKRSTVISRYLQSYKKV